MAIQIVPGSSTKAVQARQIAERLRALHLSGTFYVGYPVLAAADEPVEADALLVTPEHGVVGFLIAQNLPAEDDVSAWQSLLRTQDRLYSALEVTLGKHDALRANRTLAVQPEVITVLPAEPHVPTAIDRGLFVSLDGLEEAINRLAPIEEELWRPLRAALQHVSTIKPAKRRAHVQLPNSRGAVLQEIERSIANLDEWQQAAAIAVPDGPQRIRGLAGSGKTVVLAHKAAYLHAKHPDWTIAVTFHTRSLYQQFRDLIGRFTFFQTEDAPDWSKLRVLHSWGSAREPGFYSEVADHHGVPIRDFIYGQTKYGRENAFSGVCSELLSLVDPDSPDDQRLYDVVLMDEAQDLPPPFFQLVYAVTRGQEGNRKIVWAYDELQNLTDVEMPSIGELFGETPEGRPRVVIGEPEDGLPPQDVVLPVCYRNTPWALALAHALGFGLAREPEQVQHFDSPELWEHVGYRVLDGQLRAGREVVLERSPNSYPEYFTRLLTPQSAITAFAAEDDRRQLNWLVDNIRKNLTDDELDPDDILIVLPDPYTAGRRGQLIASLLAQSDIQAHIVGVTSSQDEVFKRDSVAIAHIFRAKGNEAAVVYVVDSQHCFSGLSLLKKRNTLFTAITRSRAWVNIIGHGPGMRGLVKEINRVAVEDYRLRFKIPTKLELAQMRRTHRDVSTSELKAQRQLSRTIESLLAAGDVDIVLRGLPRSQRLDLMRALQESVATESFPDDELDD